MAGKKRQYGAAAVSDIASGILDPLIRKRAGISVDLVQSWDEIVGERLAGRTRPERIAWPRRAHEDDPFEPATLVVACEGAVALHLQHETGEIIARVNAFLGFAAIGRVRIVQKPLDREPPRHSPQRRELSGAEQQHLSRITGEIEDDGLRDALKRLGASVMGTRR